MYPLRMQEFCRHLAKNDVEIALITDEDNIYYLTGYYDYLHMEFGRPTILVISQDGHTFLITPAIDANMAKASAKVDRIAPWNDGMGNEWRAELPEALEGARCIGLETDHMPALVRRYVRELSTGKAHFNISRIMAEMRMIKTDRELQLARDAGQVAMAMMNAGRAAIKDGVPEYEVAIATSQAGTRKAAELLTAHYDDCDMSPNTHFLQIMASGEEITKTHHRATTRIMKSGEPVFLCFCGMTNFHRFKLGFDRTFWIGEIGDKSQVEVYEVAVASQKAALAALRPGVAAETVHAAYAEVIQSAGYDYPFRCGRATGFSFLEKPQLVSGDKTRLEPGMVFAVDGSVTVENFRAQVGDSVIITEEGYELITEHPKALQDVIV